MRSALARLTEPLGAGVVGILAVLLTALSISDASLNQLSIWLIQSMLALSLVLVWGRAGIFSLGQTALYGIGGYTFGVVAINLRDTAFLAPGLLLAIAISACTAAAVGYFVVYGRVSEVNIAIVTLAVTLVGYSILNSLADPRFHIGSAKLGGFNGLVGIPQIRLGGSNSQALTSQQAFVLFGIISVLAGTAAAMLLRSPRGRVVQAIRNNEQRAELLGFDVRRYRLVVFTLGGALAGLAGGLFAAWGSFITPQTFALQPAVLVVIWVLVGGRSSVFGAFTGVFFVEGLTRWLGGSQGQFSPIYLGTALIIVVLLAPGGLVSLLSFVRRRISRHAAAPEVDLAADRDQSHFTSEQVIRSDSTTLAVSNLRRVFGGVVAVDTMNIAFPERGVHCIIGPNGAGKSTLFSLLVGTNRPSSGVIELNGDSIGRVLPHSRARLGMGIKLQAASIFDEFSVGENIWIAAYSVSHRKSTATQEAELLLEKFSLAAQRDKVAGLLSHGEQQWLEIAMVLARHPSVLLLDEPTAGMTADETGRMAELVKTVAEHATVVVIEHDMAFIRMLDAPVTVMHLGRELVSGTMAELQDSSIVREVYLGSQGNQNVTT